MKKVKRKFTTEFKLKVILDTLTEKQTLSELSQKYELHPNQTSLWKHDFLVKAKHIMAVKKEKSASKENEFNELYTKIGKLQVELDFLKKSCHDTKNGKVLYDQPWGAIKCS